MAKENMLQRALRRFASSNAELESEELQRKVREEGAVPIQNCEDRQRCGINGDYHTPSRSSGLGSRAPRRVRSGDIGMAGPATDSWNRSGSNPQGVGSDQLPRRKAADLQPAL
jgi:hypothetical protein